jgi:hypothetical protein
VLDLLVIACAACASRWTALWDWQGPSASGGLGRGRLTDNPSEIDYRIWLSLLTHIGYVCASAGRHAVAPWCTDGGSAHPPVTTAERDLPAPWQ